MKSTQSRFLLILFLSVVSFSIMFVFREIGRFDFWWWMSSNLLIMIGLSLFLLRGVAVEMVKDFRQQFIRKAGLGIASAVLLYFVFLAGNYFSGLLIERAPGEITSIYAFKGGASNLRILLLMLLIIGPGEEIFWRGLIQRHLMKRLSPVTGFLLATLFYTLIHVFTGNFMLIMAALVAGVFWGYMYFKFKSIAANVISHVIWDIAIFLVVPIHP